VSRFVDEGEEDLKAGRCRAHRRFGYIRLDENLSIPLQQTAAEHPRTVGLVTPVATDTNRGRQSIADVCASSIRIYPDR
jgi:hypothetical protein